MTLLERKIYEEATSDEHPPRQALVTIYKAFVRLQLDYGVVLYDQAFNNSFHAKIESIQYNACLAITGVIRGTSREEIYQELRLESVQLCRWYRKLCLFYKVFKNEHPKYLFNLIPVRSTPYATRTVGNIHVIKTKHNFLKNYFFPSAIIEWNKIDSNLRNSKSISVFKEKILNFIRPSPNSVFDIRNPKGIKLITRLRLGLSHLREHKFKHSFQDTLNPLCNCGQDIESTTHFFLHCPFFINERRTLLSTIRSLDSKLLDFTDYDLTQTLLFGNTSQTSSSNFKIINASVDYILSSKRFGG